MLQLITHYFSSSRGCQTSLCIKCVINASDRQQNTAFIHCSISTVFLCSRSGKLLWILHSQLMSTCWKKNPSLSSYHRLLHRITILERDNITDNFQTAYHTWLIAILLQECYIMMYINFCLYFTSILLYNCGLTIVIKRICYVTWQLKWLQPRRSDECPQTCTR